MKTSKTGALAALLLALLALAAAGCGGGSTSADGGSSEPEESSSPTSESSSAGSEGTLRVGLLPGFPLKQELEASGADKEIDFDIEWQEFPGAGPQFLEAARAGSSDISELTETPLIFGQASDSHVKAIAAKQWMAPGQSLTDILVPDDSEIKSAADLKGKKINVPEGQYQQYYLAKALEAEGMTLDDVQAVNLSLADAATAYESGQLDAFASADPYLTPMLENGNRSIGGSDEVLPPAIEFWTASEDAISSKKGELEGFLKAMAKAEAWAESNPEQWGKVYGKTFEIEPALAQKIVERQKTKYVPLDQKLAGYQQEQADKFFELGVLPTEVEAAEAFDTSLQGAVLGASE